MINITNLLESEVNELIFGSAPVDQAQSMPLWIAEQVVCMQHLSQHLRDWAWNTIDSRINSARDGEAIPALPMMDVQELDFDAEITLSIDLNSDAVYVSSC